MQTQEQLDKWIKENLVLEVNELPEFFESHEERRAAQLLLREQLELDPKSWDSNFFLYEGSRVILADMVDTHGLFYATHVIVNDPEDGDDVVKCIPESLIAVWQMGKDISDVTIEVDRSDILMDINHVLSYAEMVVNGEIEDTDDFILTPDQFQLDVEEDEAIDLQLEHEHFVGEFTPVVEKLIVV